MITKLTKFTKYVVTALFLAGVAAIPLGAAGQEETAAAAGELGEPVVLTFKLRPNSPGFDADTDADVAEFERMMADAGTPVTVELQRFAGPNSEYATKNTLELRSGQGPICCSRKRAARRTTCAPGF